MADTERVHPISPIDRWLDEEASNKDNVKLQATDDFEGPAMHRSCTDLIVLGFLVTCSLACLGISIYYYVVGDPNRLNHGFDFRAELCGVDSLVDSKYTYFVDPSETTNVAICLSGCPVVASKNAVCLYEPDHVTKTRKCYDVYESRPYFNRYCLPADEDLRVYVDEFFDRNDVRVTLILGDIYRAWSVIAVASCISGGVGIFYMLLFRFYKLTSVAMYSTVLLVILEFATILYFIDQDSDRVDDNKCDSFGPVTMNDCDSDGWSYMVLMYVVLSILIVLVFIITLLMRSMPKSVAFLQVSLRPFSNVLALVLVPLVTFFVGGCIITSLVLSLLYGGGVANIEIIQEPTVPGGLVKTIAFYWSERCLLIFVIFVHLWWLSFAATLSEYFVTSVATYWYFSKAKHIFIAPVKSSLKLVFYNHVGSIALGSILIPLFRIPRIIISGFKGLVLRLGSGMKKYLSGGCYPCLLTYEHFLKYLVEDAYVYQVIWASAFYSSAKRSYFVVKRSETIPAKAMLANAHFAIWTLQIAVLTAGPIFTYYWVLDQKETFTYERTRYISWATELAALAFVGSAFTSQVIGGFFRGLVHASVHCLVTDSEMFVGTQRFADSSLIDILKLEGTSSKDAKVVPEITFREDEKPVYYVEGQAVQDPHLNSPRDYIEEQRQDLKAYSEAPLFSNRESRENSVELYPMNVINTSKVEDRK